MKRLGIIALAASVLIVLASCKKEKEPEKKVVVDIESITITPTKANMQRGETLELNVTVTPEGASVNDIVWTTENERVATVSNGVITAVGYGVTNIFATAGVVQSKVKVSVAEPERKYTLIWQDEFNGTSVDESLWSYQIGSNVNNEKQYYKKENATISDGYLVITAKKEDITDSHGTVWHYTSSRLHSKKSQTYGKIEARISWPAGKGSWPAFWMMPVDNKYGRWPYSGEIDIVEHWGREPSVVSYAVHTKLKNGNGKPSGNWGYKIYEDGIEGSFHTYGIEWIENGYNGNGYIEFYFDGKLKASVAQSDWQTGSWEDWPFDQNFYSILNLAVGGNLGGAIDDGAFPMVMKVDWVRAYKIDYK
ncbi:MAG: family 16 glycosylhydrolase [Paludibacteraceae bacterium]|nr:family 16 glycosylhydrolase [Paludibacteraceae bacterium]